MFGYHIGRKNEIIAVTTCPMNGKIAFLNRSWNGDLIGKAGEIVHGANNGGLGPVMIVVFDPNTNDYLWAKVME